MNGEAAVSMQNSLKDTKFLTSPGSDELRVIKMGALSDPHSMMVLYKSDGKDGTARSPNPQLNGFLSVITFQKMAGFTLYRNGRPNQIAPSVLGATGLHDLRNSWSSAKSPTYSLNLVFSSAFLGDLMVGGGYAAMDLLRESFDYEHHDQTLLHLGQALEPAFEMPQAANRLFTEQIFLAASTYLISKCGNQTSLATWRGTLTPRQEKMVKEYLEANMQSNVSLADLARLCDLSPSQFARLFKRSTGTSPYKWFIGRRLALAKSLMETTDNGLSEIAMACGFSDQSHLTRTFSRNVGLSPAIWRRQHRS